MPKKSRFPQQLGWEDFLSFMRELLLWLVTQVGKPDYLPELEVGLSAKVDLYETALALYAAKKNLAPEQRKLKDAAIEALREALTRVKATLPVFFPDPSVLGEFNLAQEIKTDEDELYIQASACLAHWALVSALPEYLTLVPDFTVAQAAFADFVAKRETYTITFQAMQAAQNDMEQLRIPIQEQERKIFDWYRSRYNDSIDPWWTDTVWGTSGGGESGGTGTAWDAKPIAKIMKAPYPLNGISAGCEEYSGTERFDMRIAWAPKGAGVPPMPEEDYMTDVEQPTLLDVELMFGFVYYLWIRARKDGEVSEWSDVAGCEWEG